MSRKWTNCLLIIGSAVFVNLAFHSPARAKNCGGTITCACGDNVVANRKLVLGADPVVGTFCPGNGLVMNTAGVVLDLNNNKIQGSGNGVGVFINGVNGVTIKNGKIDSFGIGISTATTTSDSVIDKVKPLENTGDGIFLEGNNNDLLGILAKHNGNNGVTVIGDFNLLKTHNDEYSEFHGIYVEGNGNELVGNLASENGESGSGNGITVVGHNNKIDGNKVSKLNIHGIAVEGNNNTLSANKVSAQKGDGITVDGDANVLTNNKSSANLGVGIIVVGNGNGAASTGNSVSVNREDPECSIYGVTGPPTCIQQ